MELENEKIESVNENENRENNYVDVFSSRIHFTTKTGKHKSKNTKRHEGVEYYIINPLLTKLVRSRWLDFGLVLFLRFYGPRLRLGP